MKFFAALNLAKFASELLGAAGFDLSALAKAGDANALKAAIDAKLSDATIDPKHAEQLKAALDKGNSETERAAKLQAKLSEIEADHETLSSAIAEAGVKLPEVAAGTKPEEASAAVASAIKARASVLAAEQLAAASHPTIADAPAVDPTKPAAVAKPNLTGLARTRAAFAAQAQASAGKK